MNDFINVAVVESGTLSYDTDLDRELEEFVDGFRYEVFLEEPELSAGKDGRPTITICSGYSHLPGVWFLEWLSKKYKLVLSCEAFSITDDELLDKYTVEGSG